MQTRVHREIEMNKKNMGQGKKLQFIFIVFHSASGGFVGADGREMYNRKIMPRTCQMLLSLSLTIR